MQTHPVDSDVKYPLPVRLKHSSTSVINTPAPEAEKCDT